MPSPGEALFFTYKGFSTRSTTSAGCCLTWRYFYKQLFLLNLQVLEGNLILGAPEGLKCLPPCMGEAAWGQGLAEEHPPPLLLPAGGNDGKKCSFSTNPPENVDQSGSYFAVLELLQVLGQTQQDQCIREGSALLHPLPRSIRAFRGHSFFRAVGSHSCPRRSV